MIFLSTVITVINILILALNIISGRYDQIYEVFVERSNKIKKLEDKVLEQQKEIHTLKGVNKDLRNYIDEVKKETEWTRIDAIGSALHKTAEVILKTSQEEIDYLNKKCRG